MTRKSGSKNKTYHWLVTTAKGDEMFRTCKDVCKRLSLTKDRVYYLSTKHKRHMMYKTNKTKDALRCFSIRRINCVIPVNSNV